METLKPLAQAVTSSLLQCCYSWETPEALATAVLSGFRAIEPGVPGRDTHLVRSLLRGVGGFGKMPLNGPFISSAEIEEIVAWIDAGMPSSPP